MVEKRVIDPRNLDVDAYRGLALCLVGPMGSGKSDELIGLLKRLDRFSRYRALAFGHSIDVKAGSDRISSRTNEYFPAVKVSNAVGEDSICEKVLEADKDGFVDVVAIEEGFFFKSSLADAVLQLTNQNRFVIVSSLDMNFRGQPIEVISDVSGFPRTTTIKYGAYCQVSKDGQPCSKPAIYSFKVYRDDNGSLKICHTIGDNKSREVSGLWRAAEFYTPGIDPLVDHDPCKVPAGKPFYVAACKSCFDVPGKEHSDAVLRAILDSGSKGLPREAINVDGLQEQGLERVLAYLVNHMERQHVVQDGETGLYRYVGPRVLR